MLFELNFRLIFITETTYSTGLIKIIENACRSGVKAVQLRLKEATASQYLTAAIQAREITRKYNSLLFINDRYDIALLSGADGLHSPEGGINPKQIKSRGSLVFGKSVHSLSRALLAEKEGFDYILFGPIYSTPSKLQYGLPQGIEKLRTICNSVKIPVFAVGGLNPERAKICSEAGAFGAAVIREIYNSDNIEQTVKEFDSSAG